MKVLFTIFWNALVFLAMSQLVWSLPIYEMDDHSAHGVRFSGNDQFNVAAANNIEYFFIHFYPYVHRADFYMQYPFKNLYVYSLAVLSNNNSVSYPKRYRFVVVGEDMQTQDILFIVFTVNISDKGMSKNCHQKVVDR